MRYKILILSILLFSAFSYQGKAQKQKGNAGVIETAVSKKIDCTETDKEIFKKYLNTVKTGKTEPFNNLIIKTALFFKDRPYVARTLEKDPEQLVVNLRELDCFTFVETVLALSRTVKFYSEPAFENFCTELQKIRYRKDEIRDYTSRLHYTSDWIYENVRKKIVSDITKSSGGKPYTVSVSYMSSHPENYEQLKKHPEFVKIIAKQEKEISGRKIYSMIPKNRIIAAENEIKNGDIVCFVTDIENLDISHVGFLYFDNGVLTFIHASSQLKKIAVNPKPLIDYVSGIKSNKGIMILRAVSFL